MTRSTFRCVTAAALGLAAAAPLQAHAQDIQSATIEVANRGTAADLLTTTIETRSYITTADVTVPAGVNPNLAPPPSSGSPTGYNDPSLGFNSTQYWAKDAQYSGVTRLIITYDTRNVTTGVTGTASFLCSGALINAGKSVLTAGHCLNNSVEGGVEFTLRTVQVQLGQNFGGNTTAEPGAGAPSVNQAFNFVQDVGPDGVRIHPDYSGSVIDQRDIAVVNLNTPAPSLYRSYELYAGTGIGEEYNVAGWGGRGNGDLGTVNAAGSTGSGQRIRQGLNRFDISYASDKWSTAFTNLITGARGPQDVYLADFDNGLAANDALCQLSFATIGGAPIWLGTDAERPCDTGVGIREVGSAGGDSGGPSFIGGRVSAVTSFGQTFGTGFFGDVRPGLNSSFGELNGMTRVDINAGWVNSAVVPEPATLLLFGVGAAGLAGVAARRRRVS